MMVVIILIIFQKCTIVVICLVSKLRQESSVHLKKIEIRIHSCYTRLPCFFDNITILLSKTTKMVLSCYTRLRLFLRLPPKTTSIITTTTISWKMYWYFNIEYNFTIIVHVWQQRLILFHFFFYILLKYVAIIIHYFYCGITILTPSVTVAPVMCAL